MVLEQSQYVQEGVATFVQAEAIRARHGEAERCRFIATLLNDRDLVEEYFQPFMLVSKAIERLESSRLIERVAGKNPRAAFAVTLGQVALCPPIFNYLMYSSNEVTSIGEITRNYDIKSRLQLVEERACDILEAIYPRKYTDAELSDILDNPSEYAEKYGSPFDSLNQILKVDRYSYDYSTEISNHQVRLDRVSALCQFLNNEKLKEPLLAMFNAETNTLDRSLEWVKESLSLRSLRSAAAPGIRLDSSKWVEHNRFPRRDSSDVDWSSYENTLVQTFYHRFSETDDSRYAIVHVGDREQGINDVFLLSGDDVDVAARNLLDEEIQWAVAHWRSYDFALRCLNVSEYVIRPLLLCFGTHGEELQFL
jgi:hypothetical protein